MVEVNGKKYLRYHEAAKILGISKTEIRKLCWSGIFRYIWHNCYIHISMEAIMEYQKGNHDNGQGTQG